MSVPSSPADRVLLLAPIRGVTDAVLRGCLARRFGGLDGAVAPFVREAPSGRLRPGLLADVLPEANPDLRAEPQVLGKDPARILELARRLADAGCRSMSWNLGCPSPTSLSRGQGAALLARPDAVVAVLDAVAGRLPLGLTVKARLGRDDDRELLGLLPRLAASPVASITIHPRTARDGYEAPLRLAAFEACLAESPVPVVYNGDLTSRAALERLEAAHPSVAGWMIGRGLLADPLLALRIRGARNDVEAPSAAELTGYLDDLAEGWLARLDGPVPVLHRMLGLWTYLAPSFEGGRKLLKGLRKVRTVGRARELARRFLEAGPAWLGCAAQG